MAKANQQAMVRRDEIQSAIKVVEQAEAAGEISAAEATRRINDCRRAVTQRDLWKASGHRAGSPKRSNLAETRGTVVALIGLLVFVLLGVLLVTWAVGLTGDEGAPPARVGMASGQHPPLSQDLVQAVGQR